MAEALDISRKRQDAVVEKAVGELVDNRQSFLDKMTELIDRAETVMREAEIAIPQTFKEGEVVKGERWTSTQHQQWTVRLAAIGRLTDLLELQAKLVGELSEQHVHIHTSPEWIEIRTAILQAIEPFPEAKRAVREKLRGMRDVTEGVAAPVLST